jgi:hypothetical protein
VAQHGQVLKLRTCRSDGKARWAYRYRVDGSCSKRPQVGGFATREEAQRALRQGLARLRPGRGMTVAGLAEEYVKVHQASPSTIEKLRWLLSKATAAFGDQLIADLGSRRLRLARHAAGGASVRDPLRRFPEKRPFESWEQINALASQVDAAGRWLCSGPVGCVNSVRRRELSTRP